MKVCREAKHDKLLQYAERVWNIREGDDPQRIDQAIRLTENFFNQMGVPTRLTDVDLDGTAIDNLVEQLEQHGMTALGEKRDITLAVSRQILETAV